ncbi:DUF4351 domain-containing protein [Candidatus Competibacter phosphatis]|uniref:DUF4351 domain-containing protein n=1 Tax=Candidatus Competibacter phosphatis TaxID=221280 RepID=UPI003B969BE1
MLGFASTSRRASKKGLERGLKKRSRKRPRKKASKKASKKGLAQGEALLLQRQLARRFGPLPSDVIAQLGTATTEQLECWGDRVLDAASLEDVFRP